MARPHISKEKLNRILASDVRDIDLDAHDMASTLSNFGSDYLNGLISVTTVGYANGKISIKLPVFSYLVRLLCEDATDETVKCTILLDDFLTIRTTYPSIHDHAKTALLIKIAKFAGFTVDRDGDILIFKTKIQTTDTMRIYANSSNEIMYMLVTLYEM